VRRARRRRKEKIPADVSNDACIGNCALHRCARSVVAEIVSAVVRSRAPEIIRAIRRAAAHVIAAELSRRRGRERISAVGGDQADPARNSRGRRTGQAAAEWPCDVVARDGQVSAVARETQRAFRRGVSTHDQGRRARVGYLQAVHRQTERRVLVDENSVAGICKSLNAVTDPNNCKIARKGIERGL